MSSPRIVVDTNVLVSAALLPRSAARRAFDLASTGVLLASLVTIEELTDVLSRPKFNRYIDERARLEFAAALVESAEIVEIRDRIAFSRDPSDDKFLELAVNGNANLILTGDDDLLILHPFRGIAIESPSALLAGGLSRFQTT